jgi:hypothetical protein
MKGGKERRREGGRGGRKKKRKEGRKEGRKKKLQMKTFYLGKVSKHNEIIL